MLAYKNACSKFIPIIIVVFLVIGSNEVFQPDELSGAWRVESGKFIQGEQFKYYLENAILGFLFFVFHK